MTERRILVAVFPNRTKAQSAVERLIEKDFPMDSISILGRTGSVGDDALGIYHTGIGERAKTWAAHGAFWGGLWGLLAGTAGVFVVPGLAAALAAGPIVEVVGTTLAGAALGGCAMAGAAAVSELAVARHRVGVPKARLAAFHQAIEQGHYIVLIRLHALELERWRRELTYSNPSRTEHFPFFP